MSENFWNKENSIIRSDLLVNPSIIKFLGNVKNKHVLDLGCGDGNITDYLYKKGAKIIGVDSNKKSIELAQKRKGKYKLADIKRVKFNKNEFDIIYSSMVFLFLKDADLKMLFLKINNWLKKGGIFIFSDIHPTTEIQEEKSLLVKHKVPNSFDYFRTQKVSATLYDIRGKKVTFDYYHRSLSKYVKLLLESGFCLIDLEEPQISKEQLRQYDKSLLFESKNPSYIIFKFKKAI